MTDYLPKDATIEQACNWLQAKTSQSWILPRLLECGLTPHFWFNYIPGSPAICGDRIEGFQSRMIFQGDLNRLESDGTEALVNMFAAHDGSLIKTEPGLRVPLTELKFKREDVERVAEIINKTKHKNSAEKQLTSSERDTYLKIIGAMLEQLTAGTANNTTVITKAVEAHGHIHGISKRKLEEVFAAAKKILAAS